MSQDAASSVKAVHGKAGKASYGELCSGTPAARCGMVWQAWSGVDWRAEAGHGKVRYALAGMVGFGWSGKGLTGQSWEWQVWNQKKGETKWFTKKSIHGEQAKACLHK